MKLSEWFDELRGCEGDLLDDIELLDAVEAYTRAHSELIHILNKRGFDVEQ